MVGGKRKGYVPFDWYDFIWETNPQYYLNANISGGSDKTNYYVSVGHMSQDAMIVNYGGFKRTNVQMNIDTQITSRLKVGASMNGRIEERKIRVFRRQMIIGCLVLGHIEICRQSVLLQMTILNIRH